MFKRNKKQISQKEKPVSPCSSSTGMQRTGGFLASTSAYLWPVRLFSMAWWPVRCSNIRKEVWGLHWVNTLSRYKHTYTHYEDWHVWWENITLLWRHVSLHSVEKWLKLCSVWCWSLLCAGFRSIWVACWRGPATIPMMLTAANC